MTEEERFFTPEGETKKASDKKLGEKGAKKVGGHYYCLDESGFIVPGTESDTPEDALRKGAEILKKGR